MNDHQLKKKTSGPESFLAEEPLGPEAAATTTAAVASNSGEKKASGPESFLPEEPPSAKVPAGAAAPSNAGLGPGVKPKSSGRAYMYDAKDANAPPEVETFDPAERLPEGHDRHWGAGRARRAAARLDARNATSISLEDGEAPTEQPTAPTTTAQVGAHAIDGPGAIGSAPHQIEGAPPGDSDMTLVSAMLVCEGNESAQPVLATAKATPPVAIDTKDWRVRTGLALLCLTVIGGAVTGAVVGTRRAESSSMEGGNIGITAYLVSPTAKPTLSPLVCSRNKFISSDGADGDKFGASVGMWEDRVVIGANGDDNNRGSAYAFILGGKELVEMAKFTASDRAEGAWFGYSVAMWEDRIVVGAPWAMPRGGAYVFAFEGGEWVEEAKLIGSDSVADDWFGWSVATSSDRIVVGSPRDDKDKGAAYVFVLHGESGQWVEEAKLITTDAAADDWVGFSVAISRERIVLGAPYDDEEDNDMLRQRGSAYVFSLVSGVWMEEAKLIASGGVPGDWVGFSVSIWGDRIALGAPARDRDGKGSAYVFDFFGNKWEETAKLVASDGADGDEFGFKVFVLGDRIIVGAPYYKEGRGTAYIFSLVNGDLTEEGKLTAFDGAAGDFFGYSMAASKSTIILGAFGDADDAWPDSSNRGSIYQQSLC